MNARIREECRQRVTRTGGKRCIVAVEGMWMCRTAAGAEMDTDMGIGG